MKKAIVSGLAFGVMAACAGSAGPGEAGYPYNLSGGFSGEILVEGESFSVTMDVQTGDAGAIRGTYEVTVPVTMSGEVNGTLVADTATLRLNYTNPMDGCGGTFEATGLVEEGGNAFSGRARVNDSCSGYLSGTIALRR